MADQEFKIQVISEADNTGFKSAGAAAEDLGQSTQRASDSTKEFADSSKEAEASAGGLNVGMIAATATLWASWKILESSIDSLKRFDATLKEMGDHAAQPIGDIQNNLRDLHEQLAKNQSKFVEWVNGLDSTFQAQDASLAKSLAGIRDQNTATNTLIESQLKLKKILIENSDGTPDEKKAAIAAAEQAAGIQKSSAGISSSADEIRILKQRLGVAEANEQLAAGRLAASKEGDDEFASFRVNGPQNKKAVEAELADARKRLAAAYTKISEYETPDTVEKIKRATIPGYAQSQYNEALPYYSDVNDAQSAINQSNRLLNNLSGRQMGADASAGKLGAAQSEFEKAHDAARKLRENLENAAQSFGIRTGAQSTAAGNDIAGLISQIHGAMVTGNGAQVAALKDVLVEQRALKRQIDETRNHNR